MALKVPQFGAWEGGAEGFTKAFNTARTVRNNEEKVTPNSPEENPETKQNVGSTQTIPSQNTPNNKQRTHTTVPNFGAWENGENINYTGVFGNPHKIRNGAPRVVENVPPMSLDIPPLADPTTRTQTAKPNTREGRPTVPVFGNWETGEGGGGGYTTVFNDLNKKHDPTSKAPPVVGPPPQGGPAKVSAPLFGGWDGGDDVQYTAEFHNLERTRNSRPGVILESAEPQRNRDVGDKGRPLPETKPGVHRDVSDKGQAPPKTEPEVDVKEDGMRNPSKGSTHFVPGSDHAPRRVDLKEDGMRNASKGSTHSVPGSDHAPRQVDQTEMLQPRTGGTPASPAGSTNCNDLAWTSSPPIGGCNNVPSKVEGRNGDYIGHPSYQRVTHHSIQPQPVDLSWTSLPPISGRKNDPSKVEGYAKYFVGAKEEQKISLNNNVHRPYKPATPPSAQPQPSCCSIL